MNRDITEREHLKFLPQSEGMPGVVLDSITDGVVAADKVWRVTYVNTTVARWLKRAAPELVGKSFWELFPGMKATGGEEVLKSAGSQQKTTQFETYDAVAGSWLLVKAYPSKDGGLAIFLEDTTDRKRTSETLETVQSELETQVAEVARLRDQLLKELTARNRGEADTRKLAAIVESSDDAIISKDLTGIITSWNRGAEWIFGYTASEAIGKPIAMLIPEERHDEEPQILKRLQRDERIDHYETVRKRKNGELFHVSLTVSPIKDDRGRVTGASKIARDITPQKEAEDVSRRLAAIVAFSDDAIIGKNLDGIITSWNKGAQRIFGYTADEIVGKSVLTLIPEDRHNEEPGILAKLRRGDMIDHYETVRRRKDGVLIDVSLTVSPIKNSEGRIIGASKIARDITRQKEIETALKRSERDLADFFENVTLGLHWVNSEGVIIKANRCELKMLGYAREEYIGRHISEFYEDPAVAKDVLCHLTEGRTLDDYPARLKCKDGSIKYVVINSNVLWEEGKFVHTRCFTRDITEQKAAEEELRKTEAKFRQLADAMPQIVWMATPDGFTDYYNGRWYEYTGFPETVEEGPGWERILHPDDAERSREVWYGAVASGMEYKIEYRFKDRFNGGYRWFLGRALPIKDDSGNIVRWFGTCTDIDEQKRTQQELTRSNRELEEFAYVASHDLQEPLQTVNSFVELLAVRCEEKLGEKEKEYLEFIKLGAMQAKTLITELLDYSRIGRRDSDRAANLKVVIAEVLSNLRISIEASRAKITYGELPDVKAPHLEMVQLFQNFVSNAIKYRGEETPEIQISCSEDKDSMLLFRVKDNGIGIDPQYKDRVFGMFQRLHTKVEYSGTGIGLAVCKKIVEHHGGKIWVESQPGQGSVFCFTMEAA